MFLVIRLKWLFWKQLWSYSRELSYVNGFLMPFSGLSHFPGPVTHHHHTENAVWFANQKNNKLEHFHKTLTVRLVYQTFALFFWTLPCATGIWMCCVGSAYYAYIAYYAKSVSSARIKYSSFAQFCWNIPHLQCAYRIAVTSLCKASVTHFIESLNVKVMSNPNKDQYKKYLFSQMYFL